MRTLSPTTIAAGIVVNTGLLTLPFLLLQPSNGSLGLRLISFIAIANLWLLTESLAAQTHRPTTGLNNNSTPWINPTAVTLLSIFWIGVGLGDYAVASSMPALLLVSMGLLLMLFGVALRVTAIRTLAENFLDPVEVREGHQLVTTGVYRRIRHPSETGTALIAMGASCLLGSIVAATLTAIVLLPLIADRCRREDLLLRDRFKFEFETYEQQVPRWVPFGRHPNAPRI